MATTGVMTVEFLLSGGHVAVGKITGAQFESLMRELWNVRESREGYLRAHEVDGVHEIAISYCDVVAVRYDKEE